MDNKTPVKLLEVLSVLYDQDPTDVISTRELANKLKISINEAQGGIIYLKEKNWIYSTLQMGTWLQKINSHGIDVLKTMEQGSTVFENNTIEKNDADKKLTKIEEKIKDANLEKTRRREVTEQKFYGAVMELLDFQRDELKRRDENSKEIAAIKSKIENLFSNPQEQLIQNVYEPCYNQMKNEYDQGEFITEIPSNPWNTAISHRWRLKTESDIKPLFENYSKELETWHRMWVDFGNKFQKNRTEIAKIVQDVFKNYNILDENNRFNFSYDHFESETWLHNCSQVIFDERISDPERLYQILRTNVADRYGNEYATGFDDWKKSMPQLFKGILHVIPQMIHLLNAKFTYSEIDEQRKILRKSIVELVEALEKKF
ncbi:MAG: hypothetical protein IIA83_00290 [Thaumarchaeota archaeon]|nr:hypothetical protein [Nitrososphaerota archaeon]